MPALFLIGLNFTLACTLSLAVMCSEPGGAPPSNRHEACLGR